MNNYGMYNPQMQGYNPYAYAQAQNSAQQQAFQQQQIAQRLAQYEPPTPPIQPKADMVNGYQGAVNYVIQPNTTIPLLDTQEDMMYVKSMDANGNVTIKKFAINLSEIDDTQQQIAQIDTSQFATIEDIRIIKEQLDKISSELGVTNPTPNTNKPKNGKGEVKDGK